MLDQLDLYLTGADVSNLYSDLAVKLHGFIMSQLPSKYVAWLHRQTLNPFSLFAFDGGEGKGFVMRLSSLNVEALRILDAMQVVKEIKICGLEKPLVVERTHRAAALAIQRVHRALPEGRYTLHILTPAAYKTKGNYCNWPDFAKLYKTAINKLNRFEHLALNEEQLEALFDRAGGERYRFQSCEYLLSGKKIPALTGHVELALEGDDEEMRLLRLLLGYATYSGIGIKTSLGMGGTLLLKQ